MLYCIQGRLKKGKEGNISKCPSKIKNVVSRSSGGVVRAAGCSYESEIMLPNDWDHFQIVKINFESPRSDF